MYRRLFSAHRRPSRKAIAQAEKNQPKINQSTESALKCLTPPLHRTKYLKRNFVVFLVRLLLLLAPLRIQAQVQPLPTAPIGELTPQTPVARLLIEAVFAATPQRGREPARAHPSHAGPGANPGRCTSHFHLLAATCGSGFTFTAAWSRAWSARTNATLG